MLLSQEDRKRENEALQERYRNKIPPDRLEAFIEQLCTSRVIPAKATWASAEEGIAKRTCIVKDWEIVNVIDADVSVSFLFSDMLVWDYKHRGKRGDYVFTSPIENFDIERGLVQTRNSLYCLSGEGLEVNATVLEVTKMRTIKQPLHVVRAIERDIGTIMSRDE